MTSEEKDEKPDIKNIPSTPVKSSMEILSELFNSFDAEPPLIIKKEKVDPETKKTKKSKKKHKHKDKKHKKKDKKRKRADSSSSEKSGIDLAGILIKQEKDSSEKKIKIEGTDISSTVPEIYKEVKKESQLDQNEENGNDGENKDKNHQKNVESVTSTNGKKIEIKLKTIALVSEKGKEETEEGEISDFKSGDKKKKKKRKHKEHNEEENKRKKRRGYSEERSNINILSNDLRNKIRAHKEGRSGSLSRDDSFYDRTSREKEDFYKPETDDEFYGKKSRENDFYKRDEREGDSFHGEEDAQRDRTHERIRNRNDRDRNRDRHKEYDHRSSRRRDEDDFYKNKDNEQDWYRPPHERERDRLRRHRSYSRDSSHIDKKKLLEIARKNAIQMMKSGSLPGALTLGPQAQEKVIAAIKAGGKTIEELTDFCKTLSTKEAMGELSSGPDDNGTDSDTDRPFHHPFQLKDRPTSITMNIKNSVPLPIKSTQERSTELRMQFPVSSGQLHRKTEGEWVPVITSKKTEVQTPAIKPAPAPVPPTLLAIDAPPVDKEPAPGPQVFPQTTTTDSSVDIGSIVSQRLSAMRKLQENPNDVQALTEIYKSNKEMQCWAQSKQQPGQFTGTTGVNVLSQAELSSGYQAWAKKDQLQSATPVSGGMGMHLLQKMGWRPGEGLGKEKTGALEPLLLEVKLDKKGLVANEEQKRKKKLNLGWAKSLQNKHPVSLLGEYSSKKKLGAPEYTMCFECGPDHKKNFLFRVLLNGVEYKPNIASPNKKEAKANAATVCLQELGLLPSTPVPPPT